MTNSRVVVLAGGDGTRLRSLTRALYGTDLPKQFAVLTGHLSLVQATVERALQITTPDRISVVVTTAHEPYARAQLASYGVELLVQPRNLDTVSGILLPMVRLVARSPEDHVIVFPADHHLPTPQPLLDALAHASPDEVSLVGVRPTAPETDYGWIVPGEELANRHLRIAEFREKPDEATARQLLARGGLWNTFILTGPVWRFWDLARQHVPNHADAFEAYALALGSPAEAVALRSVYRIVTPASFSTHVLSVADSLLAIPVEGTGWSDWGTPARVFASLAGTPDQRRLVERICQPTARYSVSL
ncbi:MAG: sugar phosphate nucleotidyltransferase [Kofleriaceae bacterium]